MADPWADFRKGDAPPQAPVRTGPVFVPAPGAAEEQARKSRDESRANESLDISASGDARADRKERFDVARDLRQEFRKSTEAAEYQTVIRQFATALKTDATPTGDQALITGYAKMLDPGSVVREQEFATVAAGDSSIGQLVAKLSKEVGLENGGMIRPEVRQRIRTEMLNLASKYRMAYEQVRTDYAKLAEQNSVPPEQVIGSHLGEPYRKEIETGWQKLFPNGVPGQSGSANLKVADGETFSTDEDIANARKLQDAWNAGAGADEINALSQQITGKPLSPADLEVLRTNAGGQINFAPSKSGKREEGGGMGVGAAFGAGAVRGYTANQAEELTGLIDETAAAKLQGAADTAAEENPIASFAGEMVGGIVSPLAKIGGGLANPVSRGAAQGAVYGGTYGAGEAPPGADISQRIKQGVIGAATGGLAGGAAGRFLGGKAATVADEAVPPGALPEIPASAAPEAPIAAPSGSQAAPAAPPVAPLTEAAPAAFGQAEMTELAELARRAVGFSLGSNSAKRELAKMAKVNPEAKAAAERLGVDLPADILSDSSQLKALTGLSRSQIGSAAQTDWRTTVEMAAQKADEVIGELGATRDLAETSSAVLDRLDGAMESLRRQGDELRTEVNGAISVTDQLEAGKLQEVLAGRIAELGGIKEAKQAFSPAERKLLGMLGEGEAAKMPTYGRLNQIRDEIGQALNKGAGPWADVSQANLAKYYAALADDQLAYVEKIGGAELAEKMRGSNTLFAKMYDARKDMQALFGRNLEGSLSPLLTRAVEQGSKGDAKALNTLLSRVPEDMRGPLLATGLLSKSSGTGYQGGFNFANYAKYYRGLRANSPVYAEFAKALGPNGERVLADLYAVSRRVAEGNANITKTGASTQPLLALNAERLVSKLFKSSVSRVAGTAAGAVAGGGGGAIIANAATELLERGGKANVDKLHTLMTSPQFKQMVERGNETDINRLAGSSPFIKWATGVVPPSFKDRQAWIRAAIAPATAEASTAPTIEIGAQ